MYEIRLCKYDELQLLQDFISKNWNKNHIFTYSEKLLKWQHLNFDKQVINFIVAYNKDSKIFDAILGFIPTKQYDINIKDKDIWLAIWKVKKEFAFTGIGLRLLLFLNSNYNASSIGVIGISDDAMKIYKTFRYKHGILQHYYIRNKSMDHYNIATFNTDRKVNNSINTNISIKQITDKEFLNTDITYLYTPYKSKEYFINRYYNNEFYKYIFYALIEDTLIIGVFVTRIIEIYSAKCIRILDWIGCYSENLYNNFQKLLQLHNAEYIDLLCTVPNEDDILKMGFLGKNLNDEIIPNYFEPFVKKNINIRFAYKTKQKNYAIFKADSDQDRPTKL